LADALPVIFARFAPADFAGRFVPAAERDAAARVVPRADLAAVDLRGDLPADFPAALAPPRRADAPDRADFEAPLRAARFFPAAALEAAAERPEDLEADCPDDFRAIDGSFCTCGDWPAFGPRARAG
jgi:hypothetical protein